jgi:hypothetical protein
MIIDDILNVGDLIFFNENCYQDWKSFSETEPSKVGMIVRYKIDNQIIFNSLFVILWENGKICIESYGYIKNYYDKI